MSFWNVEKHFTSATCKEACDMHISETLSRRDSKGVVCEPQCQPSIRPTLETRIPQLIAE